VIRSSFAGRRTQVYATQTFHQQTHLEQQAQMQVTINRLDGLEQAVAANA
jgi:hypothetical protein